jgi:hypothetical protein
MNGQIKTEKLSRAPHFLTACRSEDTEKVPDFQSVFSAIQ